MRKGAGGIDQEGLERFLSGKSPVLFLRHIKYNIQENTMYTANLRKVGGTVMVAVPPAILEMLNMDSGSSVSMFVESGRLVIEPACNKKYTLRELLDQCDASAPITDADRDWASGKAAGRESL